MKVFKEEQRFTQTWLIVLLAFSLIVPIVIIIKEIMTEDIIVSIKQNIVIIFALIIAITPIFFFKLTTRIDEKGVYYQFFPFHFSLKLISWNEISKAYIRTYNPISDYGGWGLKGGWSKSKGKALNVSGDIGLQLVLKNDKKLLIGTKKSDEIKQVLKTYLNKLEND